MSYFRTQNSLSLCLAFALVGACATNDSGAPSEGSSDNGDGQDHLIDPATGDDDSDASDDPESSGDGDAPTDEGSNADAGTDVGTAPRDGGTKPPTGGSTTTPKPDAGTGTTVADTMYVKGRLLYTPCGEKIVLRGVNHPTLYIDRAGAALPEIAKTKANAVRLFWYANNGVSITEAEGAIKKAIENGMVPILEMHDATGPSSWGQLSSIVSYWTSSEAVALIKKYQHRMIVNIANEAGPEGGQNYDDFESKYKDAITKIRNAGIKVPLMIDGSGWGRDSEVLLQKGPSLVSHDPQHNILLSWHSYDSISRQQIAAVYDRAVKADLPLLVGEFANKSPNGGCGPVIDYLGIIGEAQTRDIGWLAWSWGDNNPGSVWNTDCNEFDMTSTFSFDTLQSWGKEVAVTDANSLTNKSVRPASFAKTTATCN
ncbi:MAG: cellulase family glycosylhydrolase [Myxococcales bacterium]